MAADRLARTREHLKQEGIRWRKLLLPNWQLVQTYLTKDEWLEEFGPPEYATRKLAMCTTQWPYSQYRVDFNMPVVAEQTPREQTKTLIHEHVHPLVQELYESGGAKDKSGHLERCVCAIADALCRTADYWHKKGLKEGRAEAWEAAHATYAKE